MGRLASLYSMQPDTPTVRHHLGNKAEVGPPLGSRRKAALR